MTTTNTTTTSTITITSQTAARLAETLQHCEQFLSQPDVRAELIDYCNQHPNVSSGWLVDMLGWHALHLHAKIDDLTRQGSAGHNDRQGRP